MTDQRFTELLSRKLSDEILADEEQELMLLLAENKHYQKEYTALTEYFQQEEEEPYENAVPLFQQIKAKLKHDSLTADQEDAAQAVSLGSAASKPVQAAARSFALWYRIAAVFILGVCSFGIYQLVRKPNNTGISDGIAWKKLSAPAAKLQQLTLTDGTQVTLNAESELKYPDTFDGRTREVYLTGEAFFEVTKDAKHPFIVHTDKLDIKVLGTGFDVKAYPNDQLTEATLLHGSIQLSLKSQPESPILLKPAEKFILTHASANTGGIAATKEAYRIVPLSYLNTTDTKTLVETAWMNNKLLFKDQTFSALSLNLARKYGVNFIFKSEKLKKYTFTGEFEKENLSEALKALQAITPFQYKTDGKTIYLYALN